ncbi:hypothetical protein Taro_031225 [Colocasia esculenta]|uniref:Pre-mRNA cleavage factor Im 25 kDa subunit n=1 Tax=Colocasia esculenta TaxID=4460 RepID=A0A843VND3_COLES|nr:hypothetical protein [Colocasia esculenta]
MNDGSPRAGGGGSGNSVVDIYPLSRYYFGSKQAAPEKDGTPADRVQRLKSNYRWSSNSNVVCASIAMGICDLSPALRRMGLGASLVELFQQPHVLLLQVRNSFFRLPGGRLRPGESDDDGLKRKLSSKLSASESGEDDDWQASFFSKLFTYNGTNWSSCLNGCDRDSFIKLQTGECLGIWWRSDFETLPIPFLPSPVRKPKECTKLFLVRLPMHRQFIVPKNLKLLAVPLCQIHDDSETYGPIISGIPQLLSRFSFNMVGA